MRSNSLRLPNLIIAGVHKAGTTAVYSYLAKHPEICPSFKKEINYFVPLSYGKEVPPIEAYAENFGHCGEERFRLEASPSYLYGRELVALRIKAECKDARIIMILRDPAERLASFFNRAVASSALPETMRFDEYLTISLKTQDRNERGIYARGVREGRYIEYLPPWQQIFGHNLKIVFFDDLRRSPYELTQDICAWLDLNPSCYKPQDFTVENKTLHYRFRGLHRFAHETYMKTERFWRRNHTLKRRLRRIYNALNSDDERSSLPIDGEALSRLRAIYEPCNRSLRSFLVKHGYTALPPWLTEPS